MKSLDEKIHENYLDLHKTAGQWLNTLSILFLLSNVIICAWLITHGQQIRELNERMEIIDKKNNGNSK
jgi:hypothetical protein